LQKRDVVTSVLERVPGVGPKRSARIMRAFPQAESLIETPVDIIAKSTGVSEEQAHAVQELLRRELYGE
jgi:excinuclease ABC subunit C